MTIKNLTPHSFTLLNKNDEVIRTIESEFKSPSEAPRCAEITEKINTINNDIEIYKKSFGEVSNMPQENENTCYIVSVLIAQALKNKRNDLYVPNDIVRDVEGRIIGARSLAKI